MRRVGAIPLFFFICYNKLKNTLGKVCTPMTLRKPIEFATTTSATTTSRWYVLDYAYDENPERAYAGANTTGGQVVIQVAVSVNAVGDDGLSNPTRIVTANTITSASFNGTIHGNWPLVRFINSGGATGSWVITVL